MEYGYNRVGQGEHRLAFFQEGPASLPCSYNSSNFCAKSSFGWLNLQRRLSKDYEALCETTETWIYIAMTGLTLRRLARLPHF